MGSVIEFSRDKMKGFTLIELIVTVAIMAILAIIIAPNFKSISQSYELNGSVGSLVDSISRARSQALSLRRATKVVLANSSAVASDTQFVWMPDDKAFYKSTSVTTIGFLPTGALTQSSVTVVICDSSKSKSKSVTIGRSGATVVSSELSSC